MVPNTTHSTGGQQSTDSPRARGLAQEIPIVITCDLPSLFQKKTFSVVDKKF